MNNLLTTQQVADYFKVKPRTITQKFIQEGLKVIPIGKRDYRFDEKDVEEFANNLKQISPIKQIYKKPNKTKTVNIDLEKRRINLELNKVV